MSQNETKKFSLGRIAATPGAIHALHAAGQTADEFLCRHVTCDWETCATKTRASMTPPFLTAAAF
jgi:hypothetical protein